MEEISKRYIFNGGTVIHPFKGFQCTKAFQFDTDPNYYIVDFPNLSKEKYKRPHYEICHISNLKEVR